MVSRSTKNNEPELKSGSPFVEFEVKKQYFIYSIDSLQRPLTAKTLRNWESTNISVKFDSPIEFLMFLLSTISPRLRPEHATLRQREGDYLLSTVSASPPCLYLCQYNFLHDDSATVQYDRRLLLETLSFIPIFVDQLVTFISSSWRP